MYYKRIVVDFDDTLAFHQDRKFDEALPNIPLIKKLNGLYDCGWQIDIFTARGSISCNNREDARKKYESGMIEWLKKNHVKYHTLSFNKPLATYYIDDKGVTPEDFLNINISELKGGLSGADIYTDGKLVHKQDSNAHFTRGWFEKANNIGIKTPKIHRIIGETITMDYIEHQENYFINNFYTALGMIQTSISKFKSITIKDDFSFESYVDRIQNHIKLSQQVDFKRVIDSLKKYYLHHSFSHGDLGINNILFKEHELYLIDPICNMFGCIELDVAKFCASLIVNQYDDFYIKKTIDFMTIMNDMNRDLLLTLIRSEIIRIYKYHPNKNFIVECVNYVYE